MPRMRGSTASTGSSSFVLCPRQHTRPALSHENVRWALAWLSNGHVVSANPQLSEATGWYVTHPDYQGAGVQRQAKGPTRRDGPASEGMIPINKEINSVGYHQPGPCCTSQQGSIQSGATSAAGWTTQQHRDPTCLPPDLSATAQHGEEAAWTEWPLRTQRRRVVPGHERQYVTSHVSKPLRCGRCADAAIAQQAGRRRLLGTLHGRTAPSAASSNTARDCKPIQPLAAQPIHPVSVGQLEDRDTHHPRMRVTSCMLCWRGLDSPKRWTSMSTKLVP